VQLEEQQQQDLVHNTLNRNSVRQTKYDRTRRRTRSCSLQQDLLCKEQSAIENKTEYLVLFFLAGVVVIKNQQDVCQKRIEKNIE
jgi:hypothetical protein